MKHLYNGNSTQSGHLTRWTVEEKLGRTVACGDDPLPIILIAHSTNQFKYTYSCLLVIWGLLVDSDQAEQDQGFQLHKTELMINHLHKDLA